MQVHFWRWVIDCTLSPCRSSGTAYKQLTTCRWEEWGGGRQGEGKFTGNKTKKEMVIQVKYSIKWRTYWVEGVPVLTNSHRYCTMKAIDHQLCPLRVTHSVLPWVTHKHCTPRLSITFQAVKHVRRGTGPNFRLTNLALSLGHTQLLMFHVRKLGMRLWLTLWNFYVGSRGIHTMYCVLPRVSIISTQDIHEVWLLWIQSPFEHAVSPVSRNTHDLNVLGVRYLVYHGIRDRRHVQMDSESTMYWNSLHNVVAILCMLVAYSPLSTLATT